MAPRVDKVSGRTIVAVHRRFFRPIDVVDTVGDTTDARNVLNWSPKTCFRDLVRVVEQDAQREFLARGSTCSSVRGLIAWMIVFEQCFVQAEPDQA